MEREGSCCGSCDTGEDWKERVVEFMPKVVAKEKWARKSGKLHLAGFGQMGLQTPKASMLPTRTNSINKTYILTTAPAEEKHQLFSNITDENINTQTYPATPIKVQRRPSLVLSLEVQAYREEYSCLLE